MRAWTRLFASLKQCTETSAPVLSRKLQDSCDLFKVRKLAGGHFDGPRAWNIVTEHLFGGERTEADKAYYRAAEKIQLDSPLPDGASASEYARRALSFIHHIRPHLAQGYDDSDASLYLVNLMPKGLKEGGRRIRSELTAKGQWLDHAFVIEKCRQLVAEEQKQSASGKPTLVVIDPSTVSMFDIQMLAGTTGMSLRMGPMPAR